MNYRKCKKNHIDIHFLSFIYVHEQVESRSYALYLLKVHVASRSQVMCPINYSPELDRNVPNICFTYSLSNGGNSYLHWSQELST